MISCHFENNGMDQLLSCIWNGRPFAFLDNFHSICMTIILGENYSLIFANF